VAKRKSEKKPSDIGKVLAAGAAWAQTRMTLFPRAHGIVTGDPRTIVVMSAEGLEAALRDAFAEGYYTKEGEQEK
jgi:hypothetical protein